MPGEQGARSSSKVVRKPRQLDWHKLPSLIAGAVLTISLVYLSTLSTNPKIASQKLDDSSAVLLRDQKTYQTAAQDILEHSILQRNKITFDSKKFDQQMRARFPEVNATAVTLPIMARRPVVELVIARPALIVTAGSKTVLVDVEGRVVALAGDVKNLQQLSLPVVVDENESNVEIGKGLLPKQSVDFITTFTTLLNDQQIAVESVRIPKTASEAQIKVKDKNYVIKTSLLSDPRQTAGTYFALLKQISKDKTSPTDYIDLRVEEKAYIK